MEITSLTNTKVKEWVKLKEKKHRDLKKQFLIEGEHLIEEGKEAGCLHTLLVCKGTTYPHPKQTQVYEVSEEIIQKLSSVSSKEKFIAVCDMPHFDENKGDRLIILDGVQDPGNLGTIIRSALSFGYDGIVLSSDCVDVFNEKVIRSTQGAIFHLPIWRKNLNDYLPQLKRRGFYLYATALKQAHPLSQIQPHKRHAIVFGNEGNGVRNQTMAHCDCAVRIEMQGFESLNVAVAAGICMYYFRKESSLEEQIGV